MPATDLYGIYYSTDEGGSEVHAEGEGDAAEACGAANEVCPFCLDDQDASAVHKAAAFAHDHCLDALLSNRPEQCMAGLDSEGRTPLFCAASHNSVGCCALLIHCAPETVHAHDFRGDSPLHAASYGGHFEVGFSTLFLFDALRLCPCSIYHYVCLGLSFPRSPGMRARRSAAADACTCERLFVPNSFVSRFALLYNTLRNAFPTPLCFMLCSVILLTRALRFKCVELLLFAEADPCAINLCGRTPLHFGRTKEVVDVLLECGSHPGIVDEEGRTALFALALAGR